MAPDASKAFWNRLNYLAMKSEGGSALLRARTIWRESKKDQQGRQKLMDRGADALVAECQAEEKKQPKKSQKKAMKVMKAMKGQRRKKAMKREGEAKKSKEEEKLKEASVELKRRHASPKREERHRMIRRRMNQKGQETDHKKNDQKENEPEIEFMVVIRSHERAASCLKVCTLLLRLLRPSDHHRLRVLVEPGQQLESYRACFGGLREVLLPGAAGAGPQVDKAVALAREKAVRHLLMVDDNVGAVK